MGGGAKVAYFGRQTLEEGRRALIFYEVFHNRHPVDFAFKVRVLDPCLDGVKRSGNCDGSDGTSDRGDEILAPCCFRIIGYAEDILFCDS